MADYINEGGDDPENAAAPTKETATKKEHINSSTITTPAKPKSQREIRALQAMAKGAVYRADLDRIIGTGNSPEYISRLRLAGWEIVTERVSAVDRDGQKIKIGRYHMQPDHMAMVAQVVGNEQPQK